MFWLDNKKGKIAYRYGKNEKEIGRIEGKMAQ